MTDKNAIPHTESEYMPDGLYSSLAALCEGARIEYAKIIPAEVPRQINKYLLLRLKIGRDVIRVILVADEVTRPCPNDLTMWDHDDFFEKDEIKARRKSMALCLSDYEPE